MNQAIQGQIRLARRQAEATTAQASSALTTLSLLDDAGAEMVGDQLQRQLAEDAANNLRSVIRCAGAALEALSGEL